MLKQLDLMLDGQGIVVFDPYLLAEFVQQQQLVDSNVFQHFLDNPKVGDEAISRGLILPIYTIPAIDYQIILNDSTTSAVEADWKRFTTPAFPLTIRSAKVVVADIYSIMDWDAEFYLDMPLDGPESTRVATEWESGDYSVTINGFSERNYEGRGPKNIGYEFLLQKVSTLPRISKDIDIETFDFVLYKPGE